MTAECTCNCHNGQPCDAHSAPWRIRKLENKSQWVIQKWGDWGPYSSYMTVAVEKTGAGAIDRFAGKFGVICR